MKRNHLPLGEYARPLCYRRMVKLGVELTDRDAGKDVDVRGSRPPALLVAAFNLVVRLVRSSHDAAMMQVEADDSILTKLGPGILMV